MKKLLLLILTIASITGYSQTFTGEWVVYHAQVSNVPFNNNISRSLFLQVLPMESDSTIVGYIFGDPQYLFQAQAYNAPLRKCTSPADAANPGECWTTYEQAVAWNKISPLDEMHIWNEKINISDTVGIPDGLVMTKYAADQAISGLEVEIAGKANASHTHAYSSLTGLPSLFSGAYTDLTGKPSTFAPSAHSHAYTDVIGAPWLTSFTEVDGSTTNEIQDLSLTGNTLSLTSDATTVSLAGYLDNTDAQTLSFTAPNLSISGGNSVNLSTLISSVSINDNSNRSLVSATNATGFQISSTRDATVNYEGVFQTTSTIGGPASITVFLETANTNSTTPGDWTIIARQVNTNNITLAIVLQQVDTEPWSISRRIPAGKYVRIRYGSVTGTATATINTEQQEVTH